MGRVSLVRRDKGVAPETEGEGPPSALSEAKGAWSWQSGWCDYCRLQMPSASGTQREERVTRSQAGVMHICPLPNGLLPS